MSLVAAPMMILALGLPAYAADGTAPTNCKDGTTSTAVGKGACSGHGGVQKAPTTSTKTATTAAPAAAPAATTTKTSAPKTATTTSAASTDAAGATAKCKDGTYSHAKTHSGACSKHGGVAEFLTK